MEEVLLRNFIVQFTDFFLPAYCTGCNKKIEADENIICAECFNGITKAEQERINSEYYRKFRQTVIIKDFFSLYIFEKDKTLQQVIHSLKYNKKFLVGILLGEKLAEGITDKVKSWDIDLIIPVPLHHLKKAERGYNQSEFIVKGLSKELKISFTTKAIKRVRYTESQTTFNMEEREANISNAFTLRSKKKITGKNILLVDDVITTGSTIKECGKALREGGANSVYACSVAIAE